MIPLATAATFVWLGMVLAISFIEAPLKFRAPEVTLRIGLGIGRLVFRGLNIAEVVLAVLLSVALLLSNIAVGAAVVPVIAILILVVQLVGIRPRLSARSDAVLAGADVPRSRAHYVYIAAEVLKVAALLAAGMVLLGH
ncbi:MAG TPA: hypothetical protein VK063_13865 [Beutenbergiaceae bacterium]|nr:hypothetical protein [Beutenbergiaceae bacterium]